MEKTEEAGTPIGQILPGTIRVEEILSYMEDEEPWYRVTLIVQPGDCATLHLTEGTFVFVTRDVSLMQQLKHRKFRYVLNLLQLADETADRGTVHMLNMEDRAAAPTRK